MDQSFNPYPYYHSGLPYHHNIPKSWKALPTVDPADWPITGPGNTWQGRPYNADGTAPPITVSAGETFYLKVPTSLEDVCRASRYGTYGAWRNMMTIVSSTNPGVQAKKWLPPSGEWYASTSTGLNQIAKYCMPGTNYSSNSWGFDVTAPMVTKPTTYDAMFFAEEAQYTSPKHNLIDADISEITQPIRVVPPLTVSLSASATALTVGQTVTLTAQANYVPTGDTVQILGTDGSGTDQPDQTVTLQDTQASPTTVQYTAEILNAEGTPVASSHAVDVTWHPAAWTVTLTADPATSLQVGVSATLTATANASVTTANEALNIENLTTHTVVATCQVGTTCTLTAVHQLPQTVTYAADIGPPGAKIAASGVVARSSQVAVTWTPPTVTVSASTTSVRVGQAVTVTGTTTFLPTGDTLTVVGSDDANASTSTASQGSVSTSLTDTQGTPTTVTYTAAVYTDNGLLVAQSASVGVTWSASSGWQVSLTANPTSLPAGQTTTLTATANQSVTPTPYAINIEDMSTYTVIQTCDVGTTCTVPVTESQAMTQTFAADIGDPGAKIAAGSVQARSPKVTVTWTSTAPTAITVTISANPTSLPVGDTTTVTAQASALPAGDDLVIQGSDGVNNSWGVASGSLTDTQAQPTTVTYTAYVENGGSVVAQSASVSVTWTAPSSGGGGGGGGPGSGPITVSLSAYPTALAVGDFTDVTATASALPAGDQLVIEGSDGAYQAFAAAAGSLEDTQTQPDSVTYYAFVTNGGSVVAQATPVTVTWTAASLPSVTVTLTANPTQLLPGQSTTVTATASALPAGTDLVIQGTDGRGQAFSTPTGTLTDTQYGPDTVTYTAYVMTTSANPVPVATSNSVTVTWATVSGTPSITVSPNPTTLPVGQTTTITITASNIPVGDTVVFEGSDGLSLIQNFPLGAFAWSAVETDTQTQPITVNYAAAIMGNGGSPAAFSGVQSVTWTAVPTVTLTASPTQPWIGQSTTLTATASQAMSGNQWINLYDVTTGTLVAACDTGSTCTATVSEPTVGGQVFYADIGPYGVPPNVDAEAISSPVTVTWAAQISLTAHPTTLTTGHTATLTATVPFDLTVRGEAVNLANMSSGTVVGTCEAGTLTATGVGSWACTVPVLSTTPGGAVFEADIGPPGLLPNPTDSQGEQAVSRPVTITWVAPPSVTLTSNGTVFTVGHAVTLTAQAQNLPTGDTVQITGTDGYTDTGPANTAEVVGQDTQSTPTSVTYTATIQTAQGQTVATSSPVTVTWTAPPAPAAPYCALYRPGYEVVHGHTVYNPKACPIPTAVNFYY